MNSIKRAYLNLKVNMSKTILQIIIFSVVFVFIVACLIIYQTADDYVKTLEVSVKNAVTVSGADISVGESGATKVSKVYLTQKEVDKLLEFDGIAGYNYSFTEYLDYGGKYKLFESTTDNQYVLEEGDDGSLYTAVDTKTDIAFTAFGFSLVEGRHITKDDADKKVGMISKKFADMNNLKVGDAFTAVSKYQPELKFEFEIVGLFDGVDGDFLVGTGHSPEEIVIIPSQSIFMYQNEDAKIVDFITAVSVYFDSHEDRDKYISFIQNNFNVRKIFETRYDYSPPPIPQEAQDLSFEELADFYYENMYLDINIDTEWYEMVAQPIEKVRDISGFALIGFIGGAVLILVLTSSVSIKKRYNEFGILLAMGESKAKIALQICIETFTTICIASVIGLLIGIIVGVPFVSNYTNNAYLTQAELDGQVNGITNSEFAENLNSGVSREYHVISVYLVQRIPTDLSVAPNIQPTYSLESLLIFIAFAGVLTIISALIQTIYITRIKPTVLLTSRR